jgi:ribA/ribD-fused uncharacterized protein
MSEISEFSGRYHFLSNFHPVEVEFDGMTYPSVEHAYQAAKTLDTDEREIIRTANGPGMAKKLGKHAKLRSDWEGIRIIVMTELVYQKFSRNPELARKLIDTGSSTLIEGNWWGDRFWGVCRGQGDNHLGRILMAVRDAIQKDMQ